MSENDIDTIVTSANSFRTGNDVKGLARAYHAGSAEYFGDDVTGKVTGLTINSLASAVAISRGENASEAYAYAGKAENKDELVDELEEAWMELGLMGENAPISEISPYSVGPILPYLNGILSIVHEIDVSEAKEEFYG